MTKRTPQTVVTIAMDRRVRDTLKKQARLENRSIGGLIRQWIQERLAQQKAENTAAAA
jgi:hypothetical protein